jgi:hypothetical protein
MPTFTRTLAALVILTALTGCATDQTTPTGQNRPSTIPWNSPASWEGPGVYGSALNSGG